VFQHACDAELGDARCGIDVSGPLYRAAAVAVAGIGDRVLATDGLAAFADGWFTRGLVTFTTGANAGRSSEIKRHALRAFDATLELWQVPGAPIAPGDAFIVTAGCDKQHETCRTRFANAINFRGFPHMPGNDVLSAPRRASQR
jgi:uncharacterized phage protein (TIGR02218 family)